MLRILLQLDLLSASEALLCRLEDKTDNLYCDLVYCLSKLSLVLLTDGFFEITVSECLKAGHEIFSFSSLQQQLFQAIKYHYFKLDSHFGVSACQIFFLLCRLVSL